VYCHPVSQIYGIYLIEFLRKELPKHGRFEDLAFHQRTTDDEVLSWIRDAATRPDFDPAARAIFNRDHFRLLYEPKESEPKNAGKLIYDGLVEKFPAAMFRHQPHRQHYDTPVFPVLRRDDQSIDSSEDVSELLPSIPKVLLDYVFVADSHYDPALAWLRTHRKKLLSA
jgi:hypothetical protein